MRVRFWGTRGSIATPGPGTIHFGGNTSCVEVTTDAGACFILDCGTGARALGGALMAQAPRAPVGDDPAESHALGSHPGLPLLRSRCSFPGNRITVCGPEGSARSLREVLSGQMEFTYFPVDIGQLPATITFQELGEGTHEMGGARILAQYLHHPAMTLGLPHRSGRCERRRISATTSPSPKRYRMKALPLATTRALRTKGTAATRASWPTRAW